MRDPVELARAIAGAQAQDRFAARLTFRSRSKSLTAADIDRARTEERSLLRTWVMRKTVHTIPTDDAGWMLPLFEPVIEKWSKNRLGALGMPPNAQQQALRVTERILDKHGPVSRTDLRERLRGAGIELNEQTKLHIVLLATVSGIACQGPDIGANPSLVLRRDWLGEPRRIDCDAALAELARRYLRAFGPASDRDFGYWSGLGLTDLRRGLAAIAGELTESRRAGEVLLSLSGSRGRLPPSGQVRLLGAFDTYLLGYKSRDFAVSDEHGGGINTRGGGMIEPVIVRDGEVLGTWRLSHKRKGVAEARLEPFAPLEASVQEAAAAEVADIGRFEGLEAVLAED